MNTVDETRATITPVELIQTVSVLVSRRRTGSSCAAQAWAQGFHELRGESDGSPEQREADKARIACLEAIIAGLIEKNERIRQQLIDSMN